MAKSSDKKIVLGKKLFFDTRLSNSGKISCASCHKPGLYFTDAKEKSGNFVHGGSLLRNTPSLYYAALQSNQFYDLRSITLEDQANEAMQNSNEFNFSSLRPLQSKSNPQYVNEGKRGLIFADKGRAKNQ